MILERLELVILTCILFLYLIHLILMRRYMFQRPIINSFKTYLFTIAFFYFAIKFAFIYFNFFASETQLIEIEEQLYFVIALAFFIFIFSSAFSADVFKLIRKRK